MLRQPCGRRHSPRRTGLAPSANCPGRFECEPTLIGNPHCRGKDPSAVLGRPELPSTISRPLSSGPCLGADWPRCGGSWPNYDGGRHPLGFESATSFAGQWLCGSILPLLRTGRWPPAPRPGDDIGEPNLTGFGSPLPALLESAGVASSPPLRIGRSVPVATPDGAAYDSVRL